MFDWQGGEGIQLFLAMLINTGLLQCRFQWLFLAGLLLLLLLLFTFSSPLHLNVGSDGWGVIVDEGGFKMLGSVLLLLLNFVYTSIGNPDLGWNIWDGPSLVVSPVLIGGTGGALALCVRHGQGSSPIRVLLMPFGAGGGD